MVKKHIIGCSECARMLDEFERIKSALEDLEPADAPEDIFDMGIIRAKALQMEESEENGAASRRGSFGLMSFLGRALIPAALVGTLVALPVLQFVFKVDIAGSIAGLINRDPVGGISEGTVAEVVLPDLNPEGYGTLETAGVSAASYGVLSLGTTAQASDLSLNIEDTRLSRYVQTFDTTRSSTSVSSFRSNW